MRNIVYKHSKVLWLDAHLSRVLYDHRQAGGDADAKPAASNAAAAGAGRPGRSHSNSRPSLNKMARNAVDTLIFKIAIACAKLS